MKTCKQCMYWQNQNIRAEFRVTAVYEGLEAGACRKIMDSMVEYDQKEIYHTSDGMIHIPLTLAQGFAHTLENFSCIHFKTVTNGREDSKN